MVKLVKTVETGVPQGVILGHLLFILQKNDLLMLLPDEISSDADDTVVIASGNTWEQVQLYMNNDLSQISDWLMFNRLSLNIKKKRFT